MPMQMPQQPRQPSPMGQMPSPAGGQSQMPGQPAQQPMQQQNFPQQQTFMGMPHAQQPMGGPKPMPPMPQGLGATSAGLSQLAGKAAHAPLGAAPEARLTPPGYLDHLAEEPLDPSQLTLEGVLKAAELFVREAERALGARSDSLPSLPDCGLARLARPTVKAASPLRGGAGEPWERGPNPLDHLRAFAKEAIVPAAPPPAPMPAAGPVPPMMGTPSAAPPGPMPAGGMPPMPSDPGMPMDPSMAAMGGGAAPAPPPPPQGPIDPSTGVPAPPAGDPNQLAAQGLNPASVQATPRMTPQRPRDSQDAERELVFQRMLESAGATPGEETRMMEDRASLESDKIAHVHLSKLAMPAAGPDSSGRDAAWGLKTGFWKSALGMPTGAAGGQQLGMGGPMPKPAGGGMGTAPGPRMSPESLKTRLGSMGGGQPPMGSVAQGVPSIGAQAQQTQRPMPQAPMAQAQMGQAPMAQAIMGQAPMAQRGMTVAASDSLIRGLGVASALASLAKS